MKHIWQAMQFQALNGLFGKKSDKSDDICFEVEFVIPAMKLLDIFITQYTPYMMIGYTVYGKVDRAC